MIRAVLFDLFGTLINHRHQDGSSLRADQPVAGPGRLELLRQLVAAEGLQLRSAHFTTPLVNELYALYRDRFREDLPPAQKREFWTEFGRKLFEELGAGERALNYALAQAERLERIFGPDHFALYPDVRPTLERLDRFHVRAGVVSNWDPALERFLEHWGLRSRLSALAVSATVGHEKPDARIFQAALDQLGLQAPDALHVGDLYDVDYVGAEQAALIPVLLDRGGKRKDQYPGIRRIETLTQVVELL
ncbi:MAG: HAD-IA family hydrolase [Acidobacteria bacterium]|nr:HAD-IA family hydrolase [Acidobacteriota bacterium]